MDISADKYLEIVRLRKLEATYWSILDQRFKTCPPDKLNLKGLVKSYKNLNKSLLTMLEKSSEEVSVVATQELKTGDQ